MRSLERDKLRIVSISTILDSILSNCNPRLPLTMNVCRWCPARRNAPTERFFVTLLGWRVCGPRVGTGVAFSGGSQHAEFNFNIHFV